MIVSNYPYTSFDPHHMNPSQVTEHECANSNECRLATRILVMKQEHLDQAKGDDISVDHLIQEPREEGINQEREHLS